MKHLLLIILGLVLVNTTLQAQSFTAVADTTYSADTLNSEIIFEITVTNTSNSELTLYVKRTVNNLPSDWTSSLCFNYCFSPTLDSIATSSDFGARPLSVGESRELTLHVFPHTNNGTGYVTLRFGDAFNFSDSLVIDFTAATNPVGVESEEHEVTEFHLSQNYPNPFSAKGGQTTTIKYTIPKISGVEMQHSASLRVYNILGEEIATLVNKRQTPGNYSVTFDAGKLTSGIYFYRLQVGNYSATKKMILIR